MRYRDEIADQLGRNSDFVRPDPQSADLERNGMESPNHGDAAFTVPLFDEFMRRIMRGDEWLK